MVVIDRCSLYRNTVSNNPLIKGLLCTSFLKMSACQVWRENYLGRNQSKFVEAANNLTKLVEVDKHFIKLVKFVNNFRNFVELAHNFMKLVELANNFRKFVGLANNFCKVRKTFKNFVKFVDWKGRFKCRLKFFLYLSLTRSNVLIGKHKCFLNTFHVSWILFTNKLNRGRYIRADKIFGTVKKWSLVALERWSFYTV